MNKVNRRSNDSRREAMQKNDFNVGRDSNFKPALAAIENIHSNHFGQHLPKIENRTARKTSFQSVEYKQKYDLSS